MALWNQLPRGGEDDSMPKWNGPRRVLCRFWDCTYHALGCAEMGQSQDRSCREGNVVWPAGRIHVGSTSSTIS